MSELVIKDGTGTGSRLEVDPDNRLLSKSTVVTTEASATDKGFSFFISSPSQDLSSTNTDHQLLWLKNTSGSRHFHINRAAIGWSGGDTTYDRPLLAQFHVIGGTPSANNTSYTLINTNGLSTNVAEMEAYVWNGTGNGMTVAGSAQVFSGWVDRGWTEIRFEGGFIVAPAQSVSLVVQGPETGPVTGYINGWFEENSTNLIR